MRLVHSTSAEDLYHLITKARSEMVEYLESGEDLLAGCAEERMNRWLDQLAALSGVSAA